MLTSDEMYESLFKIIQAIFLFFFVEYHHQLIERKYESKFFVHNMFYLHSDKFGIYLHTRTSSVFIYLHKVYLQEINK